MKRKISTLLAGTALLCAGSASAADLPVGHPKFNTSDFVYFKVADASTYVSVAADGLLVPVGANPATRAEYDAVLWSVKQTKGQSNADIVYKYVLTNKEGKVLSLKLQTAPATKADEGKASVSASTVKLENGGQAEWMFDDANGFYAVKGDSIFFLTAGMKLGAVNLNDKGEWAGATGKLALVDLSLNPSLTLTADDFNALVKGNGKKLYFNNGKNVSSLEENILTKNTWEAVHSYSDDSKLFLSSGEKTAIGKNPKLLVLDTLFHDNAKTIHKLTVDTLANDLSYTPSALVPYVKLNPTTGKPIGSTRPVSTALFKVEVYLKNDSIVLYPYGVPEKQLSGNYYDGNLVPMADVNPALATLPTVRIALLKLSSATVLTVAPLADINTFIEPLIQPYAKAQIGGTAELDVTKVYYIKDLKDYDYAGTAKNENKGKFFNATNLAIVDGLDAGQAFNPSSQYVVVKTAGTDKGSYSIFNRGTGGPAVWSGKADKLDDGIIINRGLSTDTIQFVDSKIAYTGKTPEKTIGYKFVEDFDLTHKAFEIETTSPLMPGLFMHMKADSTMFVKEGKALYKLVATAAMSEYGAKVANIDTLTRQSYYIKNSKNEYLTIDGTTKKYIMSKKGTGTAFYFTSFDAAESYVLTPIVTGDKMIIHAQTGNLIAAGSASYKNDLFSINPEEDPASLFTLPKHVQFSMKDGNSLAIGKADNNFAVAARIGDLKAGLTNDDFALWLDTARYTRGGKLEITPAYYISKDIVGTPAEEGEKVNNKRMYLWAATDSAKNGKVKPEQYIYDGKTRVQFREAKRDGVDSLIVANIAKNDTVADKAMTASATQSKVSATINEFRFNIYSDSEDKGQHIVKSVGANQWLQSVNGKIVLTTEKDNAVRVAFTPASAPTSNETINAASVKVIAGDGTVTVSGAAGKKIVVSDVLGRTTTVVAASDNETIAAPQGVVIVSVDGEVAVKAVVK